MRKTVAILGLVCGMIACCGTARAQSNSPPPDITPMLVDPIVWENSKLKGKWADESAEASAQSKIMRSPQGAVFSYVPQQVHAYFATGELQRIEVVYLEAGLFFGLRESDELKSKLGDVDKGKEQSQLNKQIREASNKESKDIPQLRKAFDARFKELERELPGALEKFCGAKGKRVSVGKDQLLRSRVTEFANSNLCMRLMAIDDQLVSLTILRKAGASRKLVDSKLSRETRRGELRENVNVLPNGDTVIDGIPMAQQGARGYCAMATLAMIMRYFGLEISVDTLAAKAGYKEGNTDLAIIEPIYNAAAKEVKARMTESKTFNFRKAQDLVKRGVPILVWRGFSRERDEFHSRFVEEYRKNPSAELPLPNSKERKNWPYALVSGGHASLVTGFNKDRKEVLFTESWGEGLRNRRMRAEEMEATAYCIFVFEP
jgi:hypothetical protein